MPQSDKPARPKACASRLYRFGNGLKYAGKGVTYSGLTIAALGVPAGPVGSGSGVTIAGAGGAVGATGQLLQDFAFGRPKFEAFSRFAANLFGGRVLSSVVPPEVRSELGDALYEEAASTALSPVTGFLDPERGC